MKGAGVLEVHQMTCDPKYTLLLMSLSTDTPINCAKAVIGSSKKLINVGNSVEFCAGPSEVLCITLCCLMMCTDTCIDGMDAEGIQ